MKILYVTKMFPYGSGEAFLIAELNELLEQGHDPTIVPLRPPTALEHRGIDRLLQRTVAEPLFSRRVVRTALKVLGRRPLAVGRALARLFASRNPMVLLKNLAVLPKGLWLADLVAVERFEHMHVHWISTPASMALIAAELTQIPWSVTAHRSDIVLDNLLQKKAESASFVRYISESGRRLATGLGTRHPQSIVLPMGVKLPEARTLASPDVGSVIRLLCPASLIPVKGHEYLVAAMHEVKRRGLRASLALAGQGELERELRNQIASLGLDEEVEFLGQLDHGALLGLYEARRVDAVVLASVDLGDGLHEGIPVSLIEAMSYGVPVIATETGGIPELLKDGAGVLVADKDALALADAIEALVRDGDLRTRTGAYGRKRVWEGFAAEKTAQRLIESMRRVGACVGHASDRSDQ